MKIRRYKLPDSKDIPFMSREHLSRTLQLSGEAQLAYEIQQEVETGIDLIDAVQAFAHRRINEELAGVAITALPNRMSSWHDVTATHCSLVYKIMKETWPESTKKELNAHPSLATLNGVRRAIRQVRREALKDNAGKNKALRTQRRALSSVGAKALSE